MTIKKLTLENFTVFEMADIEFSSGINILIGENGTGKTHIIKALYSACQSVRNDIDFANKLVKVFKPDDLNISRLSRRKAGVTNTKIKVSSTSDVSITASFSTKTKKWDADVIGKEKWEKQMKELESTFIPAKEILSNAWNLEAAVSRNNVDFDDTYVDIITSAKVDITKGKDSSDRRVFLEHLQKIITGKVTVEDEKFYLKSGTQAKIEFSLVAEGIRKIALLWQLIKNGTLEKGSVLFWDEPEANINPIHIPIIVDILLELQRTGVQIFISTHDYILAKYFEIKRKDKDEVMFYSLYNSENGSVCEAKDSFKDLNENPIIKAYNKLYDEVLDREMGG